MRNNDTHGTGHECGQRMLATVRRNPIACVRFGQTEQSIRDIKRIINQSIINHPSSSYRTRDGGENEGRGGDRHRQMHAVLSVAQHVQELDAQIRLCWVHGVLLADQRNRKNKKKQKQNKTRQMTVIF